MKKIFLLLVIVSLPGCLAIRAQEKFADETFALKAQPVLKQCEELKDTDDPAVTSAVKALDAATNSEKIRLAGELGKSCHKKAVPGLLSLLNNEDLWVRMAAVGALGLLGDQDSLDSLISLQNDPDWQVRFVLGPVLCAFQNQKSGYAALNFIATPGLKHPLSEGEMRARCQTILAINQLRDVSFSRKTLRFMYLFFDAEGVERKIATETMYELKKTRNFPYELIGELKQAINPNFRKTSAYWLGELKIERSRDILAERAASDPDPEVKKTAAEALKKLGQLEGESSVAPATKNTAKPSKNLPTKKSKKKKA